MISRRQLLGALVLGAMVPAPAWAQARVRRIGFLGNASARAFANHIAGLRLGLRDAGFEEPKNLTVEFRWSEGSVARLPDLAVELVRGSVEVLVTQGTPGTRAAVNATKTVPIVAAAIGDVVSTGLVTNLARPGGNLTGLTFFAAELTSKRLELLKQAFPQVQRVAVFYNPDNPIQGEPLRKANDSTAANLKIDLERFDLRSAADFDASFSEMRRRNVDAVSFGEEPLQIINASTLTTMAARTGIPSIGPLEFLPAGCPLAFGVNFPDLYRRAGGVVAKILQGARPGDIPIQRATRFELVVNMTTVKALGLSIDTPFLQRADRVITW